MVRTLPGRFWFSMHKVQDVDKTVHAIIGGKDLDCGSAERV